MADHLGLEHVADLNECSLEHIACDIPGQVPDHDLAARRVLGFAYQSRIARASLARVRPGRFLGLIVQTYVERAPIDLHAIAIVNHGLSGFLVSRDDSPSTSPTISD